MQLLVYQLVPDVSFTVPGLGSASDISVLDCASFDDVTVWASGASTPLIVGPSPWIIGAANAAVQDVSDTVASAQAAAIHRPRGSIMVSP